MATLATLPASITVTNLLDTVLQLGPIRLEPNGDPDDLDEATIALSGLSAGSKTFLWELIVSAESLGHISASESVDALTDGVAHGHTLVGGQDPLGAISPDSL